MGAAPPKPAKQPKARVRRSKATPAERELARRRLLLAKQLYQHAIGHAATPGALNKMIAVHNFHNSIEITLRAVLLEYGIRKDRELNIDFEALMNDVSSKVKV